MIYECLKLGWLNLNIRNDHHIIVFNKPCFDFNFFPCNTRKNIPSSFFKLFSDKIRNTTKLNNQSQSVNKCKGR